MAQAFIPVSKVTSQRNTLPLAPFPICLIKRQAPCLRLARRGLVTFLRTLMGTSSTFVAEAPPRLLTIIRTDAQCQLLEQLRPVVEFLTTQKKHALIWETPDAPPQDTKGFADFLRQIDVVLAMPPGAAKTFAKTALAVMAFALFPGLCDDNETWVKLATNIENLVVGTITKQSAKKSTVTHTAIDPFSFTALWL